jgi:hypothetical protein
MSVALDPSLLFRAAQCYLRAGWQDDACRCFERAGDHARAARLHRDAGRWRQAAAGFESAGLWRDAADCHLRNGAPVEAAECLLEAGDALAAGWLLADRAHRFARARAVAGGVEAGTPAAERMRDLILARCEVGMGLGVEAARRLQTVLATFEALGSAPERQRIVEWSVTVADALRRPDLGARLHAAAVRARLPGAAESWEAWSLAALGEAPSLSAELTTEVESPLASAGERG